MSERVVECFACSNDAVCVEEAKNEIGTRRLLTAMCGVHCDHKAPHRCLPIVRYERGKEFDE